MTTEQKQYSEFTFLKPTTILKSRKNYIYQYLYVVKIHTLKGKGMINTKSRILVIPGKAQGHRNGKLQRFREYSSPSMAGRFMEFFLSF